MRLGWISPLGNEQVHCFGPCELDVGTGGVKMSVVRNHISFLAHHTEKNSLCSPSLVGRYDMLIAKDLLDCLAEALKAGATGVAFIALHHGRPLPCAHGRCARVGQ